MRRNLSFLSLACLSLCLSVPVGLAGCGAQNAAEKQVRAARVAASLSAQALWQAYAENGKAADRKFKGRVLRVTGQVANTGQTFAGNPFIMLRANDLGSGVQCFFTPEHKTQIDRLKQGQEVTIRGQCAGMPVAVELHGCLLQ
ncbi:MAG TPA: hypothetical protein VFB21_06430 [Chthonomonadaceae bacterium]|nr:hypothetical protein [Chthonomonadaceae bacterium]